METKLHCDIMNRLKHDLCYSQGVAILSDGNNGGLALLWKPETLVKVRMCSHWYIDALVDCENNGDEWRLTGFYGHPDTSRREETWVLFESLSQIIQLPCLCIGDFNEMHWKRREEMYDHSNKWTSYGVSLIYVAFLI